MSFRRLLAMLFAVAMMFAPLAVPAGQAAAAPVASHHGQAANPDHCGDKSDQDKCDKAVDESCCAPACLGIAIVPASPDVPLAYAGLAARQAADQFDRGFLGEIATPPPRLA